MTEWTVVLVIIALVGLVGTIIKPITTVVSSITKLTGLLETVKDDLMELTLKNTQSHGRIWDELEIHKGKMTDLDRRVNTIEIKDNIRHPRGGD